MSFLAISLLFHLVLSTKNIIQLFSYNYWINTAEQIHPGCPKYVKCRHVTFKTNFFLNLKQWFSREIFKYVNNFRVSCKLKNYFIFSNWLEFSCKENIRFLWNFFWQNLNVRSVTIMFKIFLLLVLLNPNSNTVDCIYTVLEISRKHFY